MSLRLLFGFLVGLSVTVWVARASARQTPPAPLGPTGLEAEAAARLSDGGAETGHQTAGGHGKGDINPLAFQKDLALWTGAVFLVFFAILWKFAWRPIAEGLDKRERHVADQISQAQTNNEEARRLLAEYQERLAASEADVREILDQGRRSAEQIGQQILQKAKADTEAEKQRALREIEGATAGAIKELAERSATLAVELAGKLVQAELDPKAHVRLIEQAVSDFSKLAPGRN